MINYRKQFVVSIAVFLILGFLATTLASYFVARETLRIRIRNSDLPLTTDNIYSEIQGDLLRPVFISSLMANDTFLRDWSLNGEHETEPIVKYLDSIKSKYNTFTSFFVSEKTHKYYYYQGVLKDISPEDPRDKWYFRVKDMPREFEINVDPDLANQDAMTIFVNHKVSDYDGNYIGAAGVGLTVSSVKALIDEYQARYDRTVFFVDKTGKIVVTCSKMINAGANIKDLAGISSIAQQILSSGTAPLMASYDRARSRIHVNVRFIPELNWYLVVEQAEEGHFKQIYNALILNIILCLMVTVIVIFLINFTLKTYRKKLDELAEEDEKLKCINRDQQEEIFRQNGELTEKNAELLNSLAQVQKLSGFLPICAGCKKIRDDKGYWNQIETYIKQHSEAEFSHGICPDCAQRLYPDFCDEIFDENPEDPDSKE